MHRARLQKAFSAVIGALPCLAGFAISRNCQRRSVMTVVIMTTVAMIMALRSAHHAFDAANHAPGGSTDNAANRRANRASRAPAFGGALLSASNNALRLRSERRRKSGENDSGFDQAGFHEQTPFVSSPRSNQFRRRSDRPRAGY
jgi:hypothetical protein